MQIQFQALHNQLKLVRFNIPFPNNYSNPTSFYRNFEAELIELMIFSILLTGIAAYLIGAIPTAVWYGKRFFKTDVRQHGSGNAGATNVFRILGKKAGIIVLLIDVFKGVVATSLPYFLLERNLISGIHLPFFQLGCGILAVIGHVYPIYVGFKGGKGVATMLGVMVALVPLVSLVCFLVFVAVVTFSKYVSLGSMLAAVSFPVAIGILGYPIIYLGFSIVSAAFIIYKHRTNIQRILAGSESRFEWSSRKK